MHFGRNKKSPKEGSTSESQDSDEVSIPSGDDSDFITTEEGEISDSVPERGNEELEGSKLDEAIKLAFKQDNFDRADELLIIKEKHCEEGSG